VDWLPTTDAFLKPAGRKRACTGGLLGGRFPNVWHPFVQVNQAPKNHQGKTMKNPIQQNNSIRSQLHFQLMLRTLLVVFIAAYATFSGAMSALAVSQGFLPSAVGMQPIGTMDSISPTQQLNLAIGLPLHNQAALTNLLQQLYDPTSTNYQQYLTSDQFTEMFGPTPDDYQAVINFVQSQGMTVTGTYSNRVILDVSGSVAQVEAAFNVTMLVYQHPTESRTFYAPNVEPSVPPAVPVLSIDGMNNYALARPCLVTNTPVNGQNASSASGSGPSGAYMGNDFRAAYAPGVTLDGSKQTVGLLELDGYTASDIEYYESHAGLPNVPLQNVPLDGFGGPTFLGGEVEVSLDIEMAVSMAPNLSKVIVYEAPNINVGNFIDILTRMASDNQARQLSSSWYYTGGISNPVADQIWQEMAAQGQSFFSASGDADAWTGLINFPGDSPYITQVGGTTLTTSGPSGAWVSETVWNWDIEYGAGDDGIGSGGGISTQYPIPFWQNNISTAANQGSATMRNTPDVALIADNVYVRVDGGDRNVSGTSCAAPLWAGFTALINQQATNNAYPPVGFINPAIYSIATNSAYALAFHDITTGNNEWSSSLKQFSAVPGYDLCTGWGTPNGQNLINALSGTILLNATPGNTEVYLGWSAYNGATSYHIKRSIVSGQETYLTATTGTIFTDTKLQNGTTYYYKVSAVNAGGKEIATSTEAYATPQNFSAPTFTGGFVSGNIYGNNLGLSGETRFTFTVTGPPNSTWTVYSLPEGNYISDPQIIGTITFDSDGNAPPFPDLNAGSFDWSSQFYQLVSGNQSSLVFGYVVEPIVGRVDYGWTSENNAPVQNWLIPLDPGTVNTVLTANSFWKPDGSLYLLTQTYQVFFDDSTDNYDHPWLNNPGWDSGDSITFGCGETLWLNDFPVSQIPYVGGTSCMVTIVGFCPW
jgi:subtilase family serine protease